MSSSKGPRIPLSSPSSKPTTPNEPARFDPNDPDLLEELEWSCLQAIQGDPPSEAVARRLEFAVAGVLHTYGVTGAKIRATSDQSGTRVRILLPPDVPHVREFVLTVG